MSERPEAGRSPLHRVLLGVTGGIAAYKSAYLVRDLQRLGIEVRCALTQNAARFVSPLTLEVLTGAAVYREEYLTATGSGEEQHVAAARWADLLCVAPATANTLARLALGLADDFLTTTALMFDGPLVVAPAMHQTMWNRPATQGHIARLRERGALVVGPETGELASGEAGVGRMAEPAAIAAAVARQLGSRALRGRLVLVSAGPTWEPIDPVRFIANRSSGRMGFALASEAARRGAQVILVAGPVALATPAGVTRVDVGTALEMKRAVDDRAASCELVILAAAVADYRPASSAEHKLKKASGPPEIRLLENPDILAGVATVAPGAVRVGFAAETEDLVARAAAKLEAKNVHFVVANDVSRVDIGFEAADNEVVVLRRDGPPIELPKAAKTVLAGQLLDIFAAALPAKPADPRGGPAG